MKPILTINDEDEENRRFRNDQIVSTFHQLSETIQDVYTETTDDDLVWCLERTASDIKNRNFKNS